MGLNLFPYILVLFVIFVSNCMSEILQKHFKKIIDHGK